jgi:hypothetical protein
MIRKLLVKSALNQRNFWLFSGSFFLWFCLNWQPAEGQYRERFQQIIQKNICPEPVTENDISQTQISRPSLWWAEQRFGSLLLDFWFTCPGKGQVYLIVNRQIWNSLNYLDRYEFVNHFGVYSSRDQYNLEVLNPQLEPVATYRCDYTVKPNKCNLWVENFGDYIPPPPDRSRKPKP